MPSMTWEDENYRRQHLKKVERLFNDIADRFIEHLQAGLIKGRKNILSHCAFVTLTAPACVSYSYQASMWCRFEDAVSQRVKRQGGKVVILKCIGLHQNTKKKAMHPNGVQPHHHALILCDTPLLANWIKAEWRRLTFGSPKAQCVERIKSFKRLNRVINYIVWNMDYKFGPSLKRWTRSITKTIEGLRRNPGSARYCERTHSTLQLCNEISPDCKYCEKEDCSAESINLINKDGPLAFK